MHKRLFIAIDIESKHKSAIGQLQEQLKKEAQAMRVREADVKWVKPEQIHLTVKFLGDVEEERIDEVCDAVRKAARANGRFRIDIASAGFFGGRSATVVWVGIGDKEEKLARLVESLEIVLEAIGFAKETRKFNGHLTIGRVKHPKAGAKLARIIKNCPEFELGELKVTAVEIYESKLNSDGPIYTLIESCELKG